MSQIPTSTSAEGELASPELPTVVRMSRARQLNKPTWSQMTVTGAASLDCHVRPCCMQAQRERTTKPTSFDHPNPNPSPVPAPAPTPPSSRCAEAPPPTHGSNTTSSIPLRTPKIACMGHMYPNPSLSDQAFTGVHEIKHCIHTSNNPLS